MLGTILQEDPSNWDMYIEQLISKAASSIECIIMRVCKYYGMTYYIRTIGFVIDKFNYVCTDILNRIMGMCLL